MKNEKGITLVELLAAIVIAGIIIVPLLTIMTGTFTRTVSQENETKAAYIVQGVMENVRLNARNTESPTNYTIIDSKKQKLYCNNKNDSFYTQEGIVCMEELPEVYKNSESDYFITVHLSEYDSAKYPNFYTVKVTVFGDVNSSTDDEVELVTVVEL